MLDTSEYGSPAVGPSAAAAPAGGRGAPAAEPAIEALGLVRRFGGAVAVGGVDLAVRRGEIYGFLGPNGAGKSTVVRMLCTLLRPSAGTARVAGHDVVAEPRQVRLRTGVALQEAALDERQTGRELLTLQARLYGLRRARRRTRLAEVLDLVDIGSAIDRRIATYSGGMRRRLDLAAALVHAPDVLFLDEPTTGLDPISRSHVWAEVRRLNRELGMTIFLTTQYLEEADELAHRVGIINGGRVVAEGPPEALKRQVGSDLIVAEVEGMEGVEGTAPEVLDRLRRLPSVQAARLEGGRLVVHADDGPGLLSPVALELGRARVRVTSLTLRTPTLDDVFHELTGSGLADREVA